MAKKIPLARPTKIELARLKRRFKLAKRIQKIVKDRLAILVMEFLQTVRDCTSVKERLLKEYSEACKCLSITTGYYGTVPLKMALLLPETGVKVSAGTRNIAGVSVPLFEMEEADFGNADRSAHTSSLVDQTARLSRRCLETFIALAELEKTLALLGMEINKVKRINNALEYDVLPRLVETIKYLTMKFEERDREELYRLKRVKLLIEQKETHAY